MEAAERRRTLSTRNRNRNKKPLSDCTNSSAFNKSVPKCKSRTTTPSSTSSLPPLKTTSPSGTIDRDVSVPISVACRGRLTSIIAIMLLTLMILLLLVVRSMRMAQVKTIKGRFCKSLRPSFEQLNCQGTRRTLWQESLW